MVLNLNRNTWDAAWERVARELFREFVRAGDATAALECWQRAQLLDAARESLATAIAGDDAELRTALNPINPYQDIRL